MNCVIFEISAIAIQFFLAFLVIGFNRYNFGSQSPERESFIPLKYQGRRFKAGQTNT